VSAQAIINDPNLVINQIHPDDRAHHWEVLAQSRKTLEPLFFEWRIITPSGKVKWLRTNSQPERLPNQDTVWFGMVLDITAEKEAQLELIQLNNDLKESELKFRLAFENANVGMCLVDLQGNLTQVNQKMSDIFGYSRQELETMTVNDLALPEDKQVSPIFIKHAITEHQDHAVLEKKYRHRQGQIIYGEVSTSLVRNINGEPLYFISHVKDITQRIQYEQQLTESRDKIVSINKELEDKYSLKTLELRQREKLLRLYFEQSIIGMAMVSDDKTWISANQKFCEMVGYPFEELRTKTWAEITYPDDLDSDIELYQYLLKGTIEGYELDKRYIHKDGHLIYVNIGVQAHRHSNGTIDFCVVMIQDIGDRKEMEKNVRLALEREKQLNELRSQFITAISHQFRTPLTAISCSAAIMEKFREKVTPEKRQGYLESILKNVQYIDQLINDVVTINLNDEEKIEPKLIPGDLNKFCQDLVANIEYLYPAYEIDFTPELNHDFSCQSIGFDSALLKQILIHLLGNAIKYSLSSFIIDFSLKCSSKYLIFEIKDRGIGIPLEEQEEIFEPFRRGSNVGHIAGIGIGLAIAKKLTNFYGGQIIIHSQPNQGTQVSLLIPRE
jgi:PAS domain S-box-containing protein